ncbi:unnamed protein product [Ilex paraguariensis]|uniref:Thiamine pyrophosphate enzyme TPP-binding domain-containing protein n=1 Tax=Ilex paraguariensis TaxID=185542 RepID=A0ABC8TJD1_9AQUA
MLLLEHGLGLGQQKLSLKMIRLGLRLGDAVVNVYINHEKKFAFVEMRSVEEASNDMAFDGILFEYTVMQGPGSSIVIICRVDCRGEAVSSVVFGSLWELQLHHQLDSPARLSGNFQLDCQETFSLFGPQTQCSSFWSEVHCSCDCSCAFSAALELPISAGLFLQLDSYFSWTSVSATLVRYQLPMVVIVFNNSGVYGGDWRNPEEITGPYKDDPAPTSFVPGAG